MTLHAISRGLVTFSPQCAGALLVALVALKPNTTLADANWSGLYAGGAISYAFANADWDYDWASGRVVDRDRLKGTAMGVSQSPEGYVATIFAGARMQLGRFVIGAEAAMTPGTFEDRRPSPVMGGDDINSTRDQ